MPDNQGTQGRRSITLMFKHGTLYWPVCNDVAVDIHLPMPDPITESTEAMATRVRPTCPICKEPMRYVAWCFSDTADGEEDQP